MLRGKVEGEMALFSEGSSVKESPEDKQAFAPCVRGSAKISRRVTLAIYTILLLPQIDNCVLFTVEASEAPPCRFAARQKPTCLARQQLCLHCFHAPYNSFFYRLVDKYKILFYYFHIKILFYVVVLVFT